MLISAEKWAFPRLWAWKNAWKSSRILIISISSMQISIMEISMSLNGNLGLSWGITQPTEKKFFSLWRKNFLSLSEVKNHFLIFLGFSMVIYMESPENLKKQSVSIIVSIFVKKISPNNVRDFFFLLFIREKKICLWTLWNFSWPLATQNFKIGFTRKCSSHSWTGEKRSLTVGEIFFTQKRDNYTNKVLLFMLLKSTCNSLKA